MDNPASGPLPPYHSIPNYDPNHPDPLVSTPIGFRDTTGRYCRLVPPLTMEVTQLQGEYGAGGLVKFYQVAFQKDQHKIRVLRRCGKPAQSMILQRIKMN